MRARIRALFVAALFVIASTQITLAAESLWTNTLGGTFNWNSSVNWSSFPPGAADDVRITNNLVSAQLITNMGGSSTIGATNTINYLAISNGLGNASVTVVQAPGVFWRSNFGLQLGKNASLILTTNAIIGQDNNLTFNLRAGGQAGTLILSNASPGSGFSTFLIDGAGATTNGIVNAGTIQFKPNNGQLVSMNYGQALAFTNDTLGTIVMNGSGTGAFVGNFGNQNRALVNNGSIFVNAGTLRIDSRDAFSRGGFQNSSTGFIQVDTNGVLELRRSANAWTSGPAPTNFGTIFMNGGTALTFDTDGLGSTNTSRIVVNGSSGYIRGNGLMNLTMRNLGTIEARDGTLSFVSGTGNNGTWVSTNYGGNASVLNFTTGNFDLGGGTLLNSNGTIRVIDGANMTLSTSYRENSGTIDFAGAANVFIANSASAGSLTNEWVIKKSGGGNATITTGFGSGGNNFGLFNNGIMDVSGGGRLTINTSNSFSNPFNNEANGSVFISGSSTVRLSRTSAAWNAGNLPINSGLVSLNNGVLETADDGGLNNARALLNAGIIDGNGVINASVTNVSGGVISPGLSLGTLNVGGDVAFGSNSTFEVELGLLAGQQDLLAITGGLTLDSNSALDISGGAIGNVYTVATFSAVSGVFGSVTPNYNVVYNSNDITIELIPEPSTLLLVVAGLAGVGVLRRRRHS
ncbi:MAG TPA: PEP-CTERM sorting domain-containing protein [Verrucomicrobiae bacterium]|nr:PEP-CTERM sorting domain-containing protein [Verrucomicrobiae bacterium]